MNKLKVKNIGKRYQKNIFEELSFSLSEGQILGILGKNGTGKTTLLDCISGQKKVSTGMILYNDQQQSNTAFKTSVAYASTINYFEDSQTIRQILIEYTLLFPGFQLEKAMEQLEIWQIFPKQKWQELSEGTKVKVKIACEYAKATNLFLLDEPFAYLDYSSRIQVKKMLRKASGENKIILVSTNFIEEMDTLFTDVLFMNPNRYCEAINLEDLRERKQLSLKEIYEEEPMIHLFNFYHEKSKKFFLSSLLLILTSYFAKYVFQLTMPESQWDRLPILLSVVAAIILTWRINQLDIQPNHRTLASTAHHSTLEKIIAKYLLSYIQIIVIGAINLVFNFTMISLGLGELFILSLELAVYLAGMISYLILLRGIIAKLWLPNFSKTFIVAISWILIILLNDVARHYFPQSVNITLPVNNGSFYPSTFLLNACLSAAIIFVYLWLEKNQLKDNK